jgi:hypothetical protein
MMLGIGGLFPKDTNFGMVFAPTRSREKDQKGQKNQQV